MTSKLHDYQKDMLKKYMTIDIESGGLAAGEMFIISSGRQIGKSMLNQYYGTPFMPPPFVKLDSATVDGEPWHTVSLNKDAWLWFCETQKDSKNKMWMNSTDSSSFQLYTSNIDMHEKLFTLVQLRWS